MRFILSVLLATTLLAAVAVADVHHQGQQAAFRLEPRHNHPANHQHKKVDHSHHKSGTCNHQKRAVALHRKKVDDSHHNKVDHSHHQKSCSSCSKMQKRAAPAGKKANKKANADEELAFHRKISRNRKFHTLGKKKNEKRDMFTQKQAKAAQDQDYTVVRAQEPVFKTQDIKLDHFVKKQRKVSSPRQGKTAQRKVSSSRKGKTAQRKVSSSRKGKTAQRKVSSSWKGKTAQRKVSSSWKGKTAQRKVSSSWKGKKAQRKQKKDN